jgi:Malic enzyme, NAD binding domain
VRELRAQGMPEADARGRIWMIDSRGLLLQGRAALTVEKAEFAQDPARLRGVLPADSSAAQQLAALVAAVGPTALIGAAAVPGVFGQPVIEALVQVGEVGAGWVTTAAPLVCKGPVCHDHCLRLADWPRGLLLHLVHGLFARICSATL